MSESEQQTAKSKWGWLRFLLNLVVCAAILAGATYAIIRINETEPVAEKLNSTRKSSALVETMVVNRATYSPKLVVLGTVRSEQLVDLQPQVNGRVMELADAFVPGGMINEGDLLVTLDPADFENALSISNSELEQAKASMQIEEARQKQAALELKLLEESTKTIDQASRALVMREPQIASMKARVSAAQAAVDRAKLNLERTKVYAPFDAQILRRNVNVGSQVGQGDALGQLIGLEQYWIMAAVPIRNLRRIDFPTQPFEMKTKSDTSDESKLGNANEAGDNKELAQNETSEELDCETPEPTGSKVILRNPDGWGQDVRVGRVSKLIGALDQDTRLARVLITVDDPMGVKTKQPALLLDSLLTTEIECKPIKNVVRLAREYIRDEDTVWVMKDEKLEIRSVTVEFRDADFAYVNDGLEDGDEVVITTLATVANGVGLKKAEVEEKASAADLEESKDGQQDE